MNTFLILNVQYSILNVQFSVCDSELRTLNSELHFTRIFHINRLMTTIQVNDDRNRHRCFCRSNGDNENGEKYAIHFFGIQEFIKHNEIDIDAVQYKFY